MDGSTTTNLISSYGGATTPTSARPEESGWTQYLDDFMTSDDGGSSSSLATDASSCVLTHKARDVNGFEVEIREEYFCYGKTRKGRRSVHPMEHDRHDDPLEDTACSSAITNPKVGSTGGFDAEANAGQSPLSDRMDRSKFEGVAERLRLRRNVVAGGGVEMGQQLAELERERTFHDG